MLQAAEYLSLEASAQFVNNKINHNNNLSRGFLCEKYMILLVNEIAFNSGTCTVPKELMGLEPI